MANLNRCHTQYITKKLEEGDQVYATAHNTKGPCQTDNPEGILNLSEHFQLSPQQCKLILKGLKFVPTPAYVNRDELTMDIDNLINDIKHTYIMDFIEGTKQAKTVTTKTDLMDNSQQIPKNDTNHHPNSPSQLTTPVNFKITAQRDPSRHFPPEILALDKDLRHFVKALDLKVPFQRNTTQGERQAIQELKQNKSIVVKKADKGSTIIVLDREQYIKEVESQLSSTLHYEKLSEPITPKITSKFNEILDTMLHKKLITRKIRDFLYAPREARTRVFYALPKVHKNPDAWFLAHRIPKSRPIVSDCGSHTERISQFIEAHLTPYSIIHPSYVKNTYDFLDKIKTANISENTLLISLDVDNLFTNIPNDLGIEAVKQTFALQPKPIHPYIIKLMKLVLENNDFEFNNQLYLQKHGTCMGTRFSPGYANVFLAVWEATHLPKCEKQPTAYYRYLDDIFLVWNHTREDFLEFHNTLNNANKHIKLKYDIQENNLEFLDVLVTKAQKGDQYYLSTSVFFKKTDSHALLNALSYHPPHTFPGIIKSQFIRFIRICSDHSSYLKACQTLLDTLPKRGYDRKMLQNKIQEVYREYNTNQSINGIISCRKKTCKICPTLTPNRHWQTGNLHLTAQSPSDCNTSACIYALRCEKCQSLYIGQTTNLRQRILIHLSNIRTKKHTSLTQHLQLCNNKQTHPFSTNIIQCPPKYIMKRKPSDLQKWLNTRENYWLKIISRHTHSINKIDAADNRFSTHQKKKTVRFISKYSHIPSQITAMAQKLVKKYLPPLRNQNPNNSHIQITTTYKVNKKIGDSLVRSRLPDMDD